MEMLILILKFLLQFFPPFAIFIAMLSLDDPDTDLSTWSNLALMTSTALMGPFLSRTIKSKTLRGCQTLLCSNPNEVVVVA